MLDDIDKTQIGRYGTISLLKRQDPPTVVTSFGIDTEELTFGRDRDCSIRLYYADIDSIHCKIVFEERKAFIIVLGKNGLLVDGCLVYPNPTHGAQTTIPLTNNSEIEIHNKRFRFTYPPKELRAMLFASPIRQNRAPRLSMIRSAQVFSPKLSKNLEGNLRLLQSPLKSTFLRSPLNGSNHVSSGNQDWSSRKPTYDQSSGHDWISDDEEGCEEIVLVEGDNPRVVEEEKDLVIVEDVEVPLPSISFGSAFSPSPHNEHHLHLPIVNPLQTPHRCRNPRDSLHRAVLIRSAQRAVLCAEKEEDELEEMEVLSVVASDDDEVELVDETESNGCMDVWNEGPTSGQALKSMPRNTKRAQPAQDLSTVVESAEQDPLSPLKLCEDLQWKQDDIEGGQNEGSQSLTSTNSPNLANESIGKCKYLGDFRTPQPQPRRQCQKPLGRSLFGFKKASSGDASGVLDDPSPGRARYSIASGEPRRMLIEMPWRVEDLVVPAKSEEHPVVNPSDITHGALSSESNSRLSIPHSGTPSSARRGVDERERKAIRERRRSALREVDSFFARGIPGMGSTPTKNTSCPHRQDQGLYGTPKRTFVPSLEEMATLPSRKASDTSTAKSEEDEELDTQILLERMKVTVGEMRRRRSTVFTPPSSLVQRGEPPVSSNPAPVTETMSPDVQMQVENSREQHPLDQAEESGEQQPFSLLRLPGVVIEPLQDENENRPMEKSFSQLMRSESPEDLEQPSEDICHILEQDITIPSENPINAEHPACDITGNNSYTARRSTRSRTASAEPETNSLAWEHDTAHNAAQIEQLVSSGRPAKDTRKGPKRDRAPPPSAAQLRGRNRRKPEQKTTIESQMSSSDSEEQEVPNTEINTSEDEGNRESTPTPAPRTMRTSRRGVGVASVTNSRQLQDKAEDLEQVPSNTSNRRLKGSTAVDPTSDVKRKARKAKKEGQGTSEVEGTRKTRTRSATVSGGASRTTNASKAPATRSRKTPVTSATPVDCEDEKPNGDKENSRNSKVAPVDGTRVRISRNKTTSNSTTASRVKAEGVSAQRVTRTRTRART